MFYRLSLSIATKQNLPLEEIKEQIKLIWPYAITVNPGKDNEEKSFAQLERCYHDRIPVKPCERLEYIETP